MIAERNQWLSNVIRDTRCIQSKIMNPRYARMKITSRRANEEFYRFPKGVEYFFYARLKKLAKYMLFIDLIKCHCYSLMLMYDEICLTIICIDIIKWLCSSLYLKVILCFVKITHSINIIRHT